MDNNAFLSIGFSVCAFAFVLAITFLYSNKKIFRNIENTLFITLLTLTTILIFCEIGYVSVLSKSDTVTFMGRFLCRLYLNNMIMWLFIFMFYLFVLRTKRIENVDLKKKKRRQIAYILGSLLVITLIISNLSGMEFFDYSTHIYNFGGPALDVAYLAAGVVMFLMIYGFIFNKDIRAEMRIPIIYCVALIILSTAIQFFIPNTDYNVQNFQFTLMLMTLFFTIESQDTKLLSEHEKSKVDAEKANQEQTEFLTNMSHEIRTPMNTIMGFSDYLLREKVLTKDEVYNDTKNINIAAINLLELINNILDLSRIESGKEEVIDKEYDLEDLFIEFNDYVNGKINREKVIFVPKVDPTLCKKYIGDYSKVLKILSNVISNLNNYIKKGSIIFEVHRAISNDKKMIEFSILADGSYMDSSEYDRYYKDFDNIGNDVNDRVLGINIAKKYSELLGGSLRLTFDENKNLKYIIDLEEQIADPNQIGDTSYLFVVKGKDSKILDLSNKKVLIIDDNQLNINLLKRLLKEYNCSVEAVTSGLEAVEMAKANNYDLIFLDHMMPVMDGIQTMHKLKDTINGLCPVIALTANSYSGIKEMYINEGFKDYLSKPINRNDLNKLLNSIFK